MPTPPTTHLVHVVAELSLGDGPGALVVALERRNLPPKHRGAGIPVVVHEKVAAAETTSGGASQAASAVVCVGGPASGFGVWLASPQTCRVVISDHDWDALHCQQTLQHQQQLTRRQCPDRQGRTPHTRRRQPPPRRRCRPLGPARPPGWLPSAPWLRPPKHGAPTWT